MEQKLNTDLLIVGSISNYNVITEIIKMKSMGESNEEIKTKIVDQNTFEIRTKSSRSRFLGAIKKSFINFKSEEHKNFIFKMSENDDNLHIRNTIIYFQFTLNNKLFKLITLNIFREKLFDGVQFLPRYEVEKYIIELAEKYAFLKGLPDNTIKTIASKYLTTMTKLGFLEGRQKKKFVYQIPDTKDILFSIYFLQSIGISADEIYNHELMNLWMIEDYLKEEIIKNAAIKNYIDFSSVGNKVSIKCNLSMEDVINAITE